MKVTEFCQDILSRVQEAQAQLKHVEKAVHSQMQTDDAGGAPVFLDLLDLSDSLRTIVLAVCEREEASLSQIVDAVGGDRRQVRAQVETLVSRGYLRQEKRDEMVLYHVALGTKHTRALPATVWDALEQAIQGQV